MRRSAASINRITALPRRLVWTLALLLSLTLLFPMTVSATETDYEAEAEARKALTIESNEWEDWPYGPTLGAESAILMEANTGAILYAKNIHEQLYPASITKLLTALITMENCSLDEVVTYSYEAVNSIDWQTDSNIGIKAGEQITVEESLYGLLVGSANEVANALGEHISGSMSAFATLMNERAEELGCTDSHFVTTNGTHDDDHYTSAYDMALIAQAFFSNDLLSKIANTATYTIPKSSTLSQELVISSKNQLFTGRTYEYEYLVGSKTGYTSLARQTLVSCAEKDGMKLICVIMKEESPAQYTDTIELFNYGFSNYTMVNVADEDDRYTVDSHSFFEAEHDIFGDSSPILSISPDDYIILPSNLTYDDTESELVYDTAGDTDAATITYSYSGVYLGSASIVFFTDSTGTSAGASTADAQTTSDADTGSTVTSTETDATDAEDASDAADSAAASGGTAAADSAAAPQDSDSASTADTQAASADTTETAETADASDTASGSSAEDPDSSRIYINVLFVTGGILAVWLMLHFLIWLISILRNYNFSGRHREKGRRRKRRRKAYKINLDQYDTHGSIDNL